MAQFTAQGRLKMLFNADGMSIGFEPRDPSHHHMYKLLSGGGGLRFTDPPTIPLKFHKRKMGFKFDGTRIPASSSSSSSSTSKKSKQLSGEQSLKVAGKDSDSVVDEILDEPGDFERDELSCFRGLVLDIAYRPVNVVCWKRAICLEFMEKADVLEYYEQTVNSPSGSFCIPAVLRVPHLLQAVKRRRIKNTLSRKNIFFRDAFTCQYCSSGENLTVDHVLPIVRGGEWMWENLVTACGKCNSKKGQKTLEEANMKLLKAPKAPKDYDILAVPLTTTAIRMLKVRKGTPQEWRQYLGQPSSEL